MKNIVVVTVFFAFMGCFIQQGRAEEKTYQIEVLQVTSIDPFDKAFKGFMSELARNGLVEGKNLKVNKRIVDFDVEKGGLWKKVGVLMSIKSHASEIVAAKPDLVLTIGTPATKYAKDKIISAGIPLVFTAVAYPKAAGCASLTEAGKGFTGSTLWMDVKGILQIMKLAFPDVKTVGIVHTDDENAVAAVEDVKKTAPTLGITSVSKEVNMKDSITPALEELRGKGAQAFIVPLDTYYGMRDYEPCHKLGDFSMKHKIPVVSFILLKVPGAVLYIGADFNNIGSYAGKQAVKILKEGARPESLPVMRQDELKILVDTKRMQALGINLPIQILQLAKPVE